MEIFLILACLATAAAFFGLLATTLKDNKHKQTLLLVENKVDKANNEIAFLRQALMTRLQENNSLIHTFLDQAPKPAKDIKAYATIREGFSLGAEFSTDEESNNLLDSMQSAIAALHRNGVIYMWINDIRHEVKAAFNPNDTIYGDFQ